MPITVESPEIDVTDSILGRSRNQSLEVFPPLEVVPHGSTNRASTPNNNEQSYAEGYN